VLHDAKGDLTFGGIIPCIFPDDARKCQLIAPACAALFRENRHPIPLSFHYIFLCSFVPIAFLFSASFGGWSPPATATARISDTIANPPICYGQGERKSIQGWQGCGKWGAR
jgi:hypothetical protein